VHASWHNQVEIYFSVIQRKVLTPNDFTDLDIEIMTQTTKQYTSGDFAELARANGVVLSVGGKGECWDKALVSYCTSCRWWGQNSLMKPASHTFDQPRVAGCGRFEEPDVLVVGLVRDEQTGEVPGLDGRGAHVEAFGDLGNGEQTAGTQPHADFGWHRVLSR